MEPLLQTLIAFFAAKGVAPAEANLDNLEGAYLYELPTRPDNAYAFNLYSQQLPSLVGKGFQLVNLHIVVRNKDRLQAYDNIQQLFSFIVSLANPETDGFQEIDGAFFMFDVQNGPVYLSVDEHQNVMWSLSVPIKCKLNAWTPRITNKTSTSIQSVGAVITGTLSTT